MKKFIFLFLFLLLLFSCLNDEVQELNVFEEIAKTDIVFENYVFLNDVENEYRELKERIVLYIKNEDFNIEQENIANEVRNLRLYLFEIMENERLEREAYIQTLLYDKIEYMEDYINKIIIIRKILEIEKQKTKSESGEYSFPEHIINRFNVQTIPFIKFLFENMLESNDVEELHSIRVDLDRRYDLAVYNIVIQNIELDWGYIFSQSLEDLSHIELEDEKFWNEIQKLRDLLNEE